MPRSFTALKVGSIRYPPRLINTQEEKKTASSRSPGELGVPGNDCRRSEEETGWSRARKATDRVCLAGVRNPMEKRKGALTERAAREGGAAICHSELLPRSGTQAGAPLQAGKEPRRQPGPLAKTRALLPKRRRMHSGTHANACRESPPGSEYVNETIHGEKLRGAAACATAMREPSKVGHFAT